MRESFVFYTKWRKQIDRLSVEQRGHLFYAILCYQSGEDVPFMDAVTEMAFEFIKDQMDADAEKYERTCEARRESGKKGGRPKKNREVIPEEKEEQEKPNGFSENQSENLGFEKNPDNDNDNDNDNENDNENENDKEIDIVPQEKPKEVIPFDEIVGYLNEKAGTRFKASSADTRRHIRARWAEGFRLEDFKTVIDKKVAEWGTDAKMLIYLRPLTLFSTKFESYLNQPIIEKVANAAARNAFNNFEQWDASEWENLDAILDRQFAEMGG